jgi:hypothetical protein
MPQPTEVAAFGTRGDGKTWGAFGAMIVHAQQHHAAGFPLPTKWLGAADTFQSHKSKTHESLLAPGWQGTWSLKDDGHLAAFVLDGAELVHLRLFGVEDQSGMDRLRAECHGLWFEEPAPSSVLVTSSGLSESAWGLGLTSRRLPTYRAPAIMTLNYPDEDHWTWRRFVTDQHPGTAYVRIPPGEYASAEQREEWTRALANRPDMLKRLLAGEPGAILLGQAVARGWNGMNHVAEKNYEPVEYAPLWIGWDAGHTPSTIIGQRVEGRVRVYAALCTQGAGTRQHIDAQVRPWLEAHAPWALRRRDDPMLFHAYDPSMNTGDQSDTDASPIRVIQSLLGGVLRAGAVSWEGRRDPMLALFNQAVGGAWALQVNPGKDTDLLRRAWDGRWHYATKVTGELRSIQPAKPNPPWADIGDAGCYFIGGVAPQREKRTGPVQTHAVVTGNPWDSGRSTAPRYATSSTRWG